MIYFNYYASKAAEFVYWHIKLHEILGKNQCKGSGYKDKISYRMELRWEILGNGSYKRIRISCLLVSRISLKFKEQPIWYNKCNLKTYKWDIGVRCFYIIFSIICERRNSKYTINNNLKIFINKECFNKVKFINGNGFWNNFCGAK